MRQYDAKGMQRRNGRFDYSDTPPHTIHSIQHVDAEDHLSRFLLNGTPFEPVPRKETRKPFGDFDELPPMFA